MCAEEKLCVVEVVKIVYGCSCAELNALDLLEIDEINLLRIGGSTTVLDTREGILKR